MSLKNKSSGLEQQSRAAVLKFDTTDDHRVREWAHTNRAVLEHPRPSREERRIISLSLEETERAITQLQLEFAKKRALLAPIKMLPPEMLCQVFASAITADHRARLKILLVCHKWNQLCVNTPELWRDLTLKNCDRCSVSWHDDECSTARRMSFFLGRAGTTLLDIDLASYRDSSSDLLHNCVGFRRINDLRSRTRSLNISCALANVTLLNVALKEDNGFTRLQYLRLTGTTSCHLLPGQCIVFPQLIVLTLEHVSGSQPILFSCPELTRLTVHSVDIYPPFIRFLNSLPKLEYIATHQCHLLPAGTDPAFPPGTFPYLRHIHFTAAEDWTREPAPTLLLAAPSVQKMTVSILACMSGSIPAVAFDSITDISFIIQKGKENSTNRRRRTNEDLPRKTDRLSRIATWIQSFPRAERLSVDAKHAADNGSEFMNVLLESPRTTRSKHLMCLKHLHLRNVDFTAHRLEGFLIRRSLKADGGKIMKETDGLVACRVTLATPHFTPFVFSGAKNDFASLARVHFNSYLAQLFPDRY